MTRELFQKYLNGLCAPEEKEQVEHWLHTSSNDQLDELLMPRWENDTKEMPVQQYNTLWHRLHTNIRPARVISLKPYLVAASVIIILATAWWWLYQQPAPAPVTAKSSTTAPGLEADELLTVINTGAHKKIIHLPDSSLVTLNGHSELRYKKLFTGNSRDIYLQGSAVFTVAKDKQRPFTVYSGDISTTALGTQFLVKTEKKYVQVKLYEGKVVVRNPGKETYLLPGQQLTYTINEQVATVTPIHTSKTPVAGKPAAIIKDLSFDNTPLPEVFEKLQMRYAVTIEYNKADVEGMYFTGAIAVKDALPVVLKAITQMNGLELTEQDKVYSIRPISH